MSDLHNEQENFSILDNIGFLLGTTCQIKDRLLEQQLTSADLCEEITSTQAKVLFQVYKFQNYRPSDIGKILNVDNSTITRMVDRLEKKGLIQRIADPKDRRSFLLDLTEKGLLVVQQALPLGKNAMDQLLQSLSKEEEQQLRLYLKKIIVSVAGDSCLQRILKADE